MVLTGYFLVYIDMTIYPAQIDNTISLPTVTDNLTPVTSSFVNGLRNAIISIEQTLGVSPAGVYTNVAGRLLTLENNLGNLRIITLDGDLGGTLANPLVVGIQGRPVSNAQPTLNQVLSWDGIAWAPTSTTGGDIIFSQDLSGTDVLQTVVGIQTHPIPAPSEIDTVITWTGSALIWSPRTSNTLTPPSNGSWSVTDWYIDPQQGSDSNNGTNSATPLRTFAQLAQLWGTLYPVLNQDTRIHFLSSQLDDSDPILLLAYLNKGASIFITGPLGPAQLVASGTLSGVVAKNRTTGQLLESTLDTAVSINQLIDITIAGVHTRGWTYALVSGTTWKLSQLQDIFVPAEGNTPTENDGAANGDAYSVYSPVQINLCALNPTVLEYNGTFDNGGWVTQVEIVDLSGGQSDCFFGPYANLVDTLTTRSIRNGAISPDIAPQLINFSGTPGGDLADTGFCDIWGGIIGGFSEVFGFIGNDAIVSSSRIDIKGAINSVFIETGSTITSEELCSFSANGFASGPFVWGGGTIDTGFNGGFIYPGGVGAAAACFLNAGGLKINGGTTAFSATEANPSVINGNVPLSPTALDAVAGATGFGGTAWRPGGGYITNNGF